MVYPTNTFAPTSYINQPEGGALLDLTFTQKSSATAGYYGKYYFTYTPNNYVMDAFSTSGNPQFLVAPTSGTTAATAYSRRYNFAPDIFYQKNVFDMTPLWNTTSQNFTYYLNPCYLSSYMSAYGNYTMTPGWQMNNFGAAAQICPRNDYNKELYSTFRPGITSLVPTSLAAGIQSEIAVDGRMNFPTNGTPPGAADTYYVSRHNGLWDSNHSDDYNSVLSDSSDLNQGTKMNNKNPWYCQTSAYLNRSFCVMTSSASSLIYNYAPGAGLTATASWSPYWQSVNELGAFEDWYMNRWYNVTTPQFSYNYYLDVDLTPTLAKSETLYSNLLLISNDSKNTRIGFEKQFPSSFQTLNQNQFLLGD